MPETTAANVPSIQPRAIIPGKPAINTVYQLRLNVVSDAENSEDIYNKCILQTLDWIACKYPEKLPSGAYSRKGFSCEIPGQRIDCAAHEGSWAIRLEQPDSPLLGKPAVGGRTWTTDISLSEKDNQIIFGIKVICASLPGCNDEIFLTRPRIVKDIAAGAGLYDAVRLRPTPFCLGKDFSVEEFYRFVTAPHRSLPVIALTQPQEPEFSPGIRLAPYVLDENSLAEKAFGYAHVVLIPWNISFDWTRKAGKPWSLYNGAVRTYMPGLNFETNALYQHPLTLLEKIMFWKNPGSTAIAERAFTDFLVRFVQTAGLARWINWSATPFVNDIELAAARAEQERITLLLQNSKTDKDTLQYLKVQSESMEREIAALKKALQEKTDEINGYCELATQAENDRAYYEDENKKLRARLNSIRMDIEKKQKQKIDDAVPIPSALDDLEEWAAENLIGRLVLHPRAFQGIKKSEYNNPELVYQALLLLAGAYRDMKLNMITRDEYFAARDRLQLKDGGSIDESRAGEYGATYFVQYPVGTQNRRFLENHLRCGGSTRDPARCLAIYYFWDDDTQQVVVGWLPGHLENRLT